MENKEPIFSIARHRIGTDGSGVTTLVGFWGCPLRCRYCLNAVCFAPGTQRELLTPQQLYERVKCDQLYFLASGGGVTFGGGEPLLRPDFLREFRRLCGSQWHLCAETSLAVPWEHARMAAEVIDFFFVDCKDTDSEIYHSYTGKDNREALENLERLAKLIGPERIMVRVPEIPGYNTPESCEKSVQRLREMGLTQFDRFCYIAKEWDKKKEE
mgnify:CR=1 FL=1